MKVFKRAARSVPSSGELWARFFRFLVCRYFFLSMVELTRATQERIKSEEVTVPGKLYQLQTTGRVAMTIHSGV